MSRVYNLFKVVSAESQGLLIVNKHNFEHFIRFLSAQVLSDFEAYSRIIPPESLNATGVIDWMKTALERLNVTQKSVAEKLEIDPGCFSKYLKGLPGQLAEEQISKIIEDLTRRLITDGLLRP